MSQREEDIAAALSSVEDRISAAATTAGRKRSEISLIAVTKTYPVTDVQILRNLGVENFGENRSDEGSEKSEIVPATWHFQGQVQSRKLKDIAHWASFIHSIDSSDHITKLSRICAERDRKISIFLQLSLDGAPDRGGVRAEELNRLADQVATDTNLHLAGLMCVPPVEYEFDRAFSEIAEAHTRFKNSHPGATALSAGMSSDFEVAIAYGATHLRVGSEILGSRTHHP
jgi:pyridoxal phosphate enzyme (YggS family)